MQTAATFLATVLAAFGAGGATSTPALVQSCVTLERTLSLGSMGSDVMRLQQFLGVKNSGYFGPLTQQKLVAWQIAHRVVPSAKSLGAGVAGPKTRAALRCTNTSPLPTVSSTTVNVKVAPLSPPPATSTSVIPTTNTTTNNESGSSGGGSGGYMGPAGYFCQALGPQPTAATCTIGSWQTIQDEAGCYVWDCSDMSQTEG